MSMQYLKNVSTLVLHADKCTGCGMCVQVCPHHVFDIQSGKAMISDKNDCMECGACMANCRFGAIEVRSGVGCAAAVIQGRIKGTEPSCGCSDGTGGCC